MMRRYTFKLYPNRAQEAALREQARMCALLWNALLEMRETYYRRARQRGAKKTSLTAFDQGKDITALRAALPEWRAQPRGTQERVADMLDLAFTAFFRRAKEGAGAASGYPKFKSTMRAGSLPMREPAKSGWSVAPSQEARTAHSGPARKGEPNGDAQGSPRARGEEGRMTRPNIWGSGVRISSGAPTLSRFFWGRFTSNLQSVYSPSIRLCSLAHSRPARRKNRPSKHQGEL